MYLESAQADTRASRYLIPAALARPREMGQVKTSKIVPVWVAVHPPFESSPHARSCFSNCVIISHTAAYFLAECRKCKTGESLDHRVYHYQYVRAGSHCYSYKG